MAVDRMDMVLIDRRQLERLLGAAARGTRARLAADLIADPQATNRLLPLTVSAILDRAYIAIIPAGQQPQLQLNHPLRKVFKVGVVEWPAGGIWDPAVRAALKAVEQAPTADELATLGLIDFFFGPDILPSHEGIPGWGDGAAHHLPWHLCDVKTPPASFTSIATTLRSNPFYCPNRPTGLSVKIGFPSLASDPYTNSVSSYFGLSTLSTWGELREPVLNVLNLLKMLHSYPLPAIANIPVGNWMRLEQPGLTKLVREPGPLTQDIARFFVTMSLAANWNILFDRAKDHIEDTAKRQKFKMIVLAVGLAVFGAVVGWAVASALIVKGVAAATALFTDKEKKEMAEGLQNLAGQLTQTEPGFAGQLTWTSEYIESLLLYPDVPVATPPPPPSGPAGDSALQAAVGLGLPAVLSIAISALARS